MGRFAYKSLTRVYIFADSLQSRVCNSDRQERYLAIRALHSGPGDTFCVHTGDPLPVILTPFPFSNRQFAEAIASISLF